MRNQSFLSIIVILCLCTQTFAATWRVNNADPTAQFTDTDVAHDSPLVLDGDTLYVEGSITYYTSFDCTKRLTIIGPGYFHEENKKTANVFSAKINTIDFEDGSQGSKVIGMTFDFLSSSAANAYTDNIAIERCYMRGKVSIKNVTGIRINGNYLGGVDDFLSSTSFDEVYFTNNIISSTISFSNNSNITVCNNNIFLTSSHTLRATQVRSNIFIPSSLNLNINSATIENNIATNNQLGSNNINVNDIAALFVGGSSPDEQYQLSESSAAKGAGYQGVDCGVFGGDDSYCVSGLPPLPIITVLEVDDAASVQTGLNVKMTIISK